MASAFFFTERPEGEPTPPQAAPPPPTPEQEKQHQINSLRERMNKVLERQIEIEKGFAKNYSKDLHEKWKICHAEWDDLDKQLKEMETQNVH